MSIPTRFYKEDEPRPIAGTVGELKALLSELPDTLRCEIGFSDKVELVVYNIGRHGTHGEHLSFREPEADDE